VSKSVIESALAETSSAPASLAFAPLLAAMPTAAAPPAKPSRGLSRPKMPSFSKKASTSTVNGDAAAKANKKSSFSKMPSFSKRSLSFSKKNKTVAAPAAAEAAALPKAEAAPVVTAPTPASADTMLQQANEAIETTHKEISAAASKTQTAAPPLAPDLAPPLAPDLAPPLAPDLAPPIPPPRKVSSEIPTSAGGEVDPVDALAEDVSKSVIESALAETSSAPASLDVGIAPVAAAEPPAAAAKPPAEAAKPPAEAADDGTDEPELAALQGWQTSQMQKAPLPESQSGSLSLVLILGVLGLAMLASMYFSADEPPAPEPVVKPPPNLFGFLKLGRK